MMWVLTPAGEAAPNEDMGGENAAGETVFMKALLVKQLWRVLPVKQLFGESTAGAE